MRFTAIIAALVLAAAPALGSPIVKVYAGAQGAWFDDAARPSDFEAGANGRASLSPHIDLVASTYYGFSHSYLRGSGGVRITATDVDDPNFSIGLGLQYQASSEPAIRAEEWAPDVSIGWRPWPLDLPKVVLIGQGSYGLTSNQANIVAGVRYELGGFGR